jgi:two-component system cell cycle response regulator
LKEPTKVIVADDDPTSLKLVCTLLRQWGFEVKPSRNGDEAVSCFESEPDTQIVILDWMMPGLDGPSACRRIRAMEAGKYTYLLLLTCRGDKEDIVSGLRDGADDYVTKPFDAMELQQRIRAGVRVVELQRALLERASRDPLTQLLNRIAIHEVLKKELDRSSRAENVVSVAMVDVDHFKKINDQHGHLLGDGVLQETASSLCSAVRSFDSVGRWGGEEFIIVLPDSGLDSAVLVAERLRAEIKRPMKIDAVEIYLTISAGVASTENGGLTPDNLVRLADEALYQAKHGGRDQVQKAQSIDDQT